MEGPKRILLVEDEFLVAEEMSEEVRDLGFEVVGPCSSIEEAVEAIRSEDHIDGALIDINLNGVWAYPIADELRAREIPFAFTTGYDNSSISREYTDVPRLNKPIPFRALRNTIQAVLNVSASDHETSAP